MGLIREPKNVDFTVIDQPWTIEEKSELSAYIKLKKENSREIEKKKITRKNSVSKKT